MRPGRAAPAVLALLLAVAVLSWTQLPTVWAVRSDLLGHQPHHRFTSLLDDGRPCLVVYLAYEDERLRARFPEVVEGYPVLVEVSGEFRAMPDTGSGGVGP